MLRGWLMAECDCNCNSSERTAYCDCQWGSDTMPTQTATLCKMCCEELWEALNPLLQINKAWYRIDAPGKIRRTINAG